MRLLPFIRPLPTLIWVAGCLVLMFGVLATPSIAEKKGVAQNTTHEGDWPGLLLLIDESIPHGFSLAKKAVAFFRISRSIRNRRFSDSSSWIRCCSVGRLPLPGKASVS